MFVSVILALLCTFASGDEILSSITERRSTKTTEEIYESCPRTGYTIEGMKWTSCTEERRVVIGCVTEAGKKVKFGTIWVDDKAEWTCLQDGEEVIIKPTACVKNGEVHRIGTVFTMGNFFYKCVAAKQNGLSIMATGCADSFNALVPIGDTFNKGNFVFRCEMSHRKLVTVGEQCLVQSMHKAYAIGDRWVDSEYVFECQRKGKRGIRTDVVGCADKEGAIYETGDRYVSGAVVFECQQTDDTIAHKPVACYARDHRGPEFRHYEIGDRWYETYKEGFGYWMQCAEDLSRRAVGCILHDGDKTLSLDANCGALWKNKVFVCKQVDESSLMARLMKYPASTPLDRFLNEQGLGTCEVVVKSAKEELAPTEF